MEDTEESCSSNNGSKTPDIDTTASTPYVSAPSSPGREPLYSHSGFFYSAPSSPMHHMLSSASFTTPLEDAGGSFEFELSGEPAPLESMTSADELFLNGQIRPMKLSSHLQRHQDQSPLTDNACNEDNADRKYGRGRVNFPARDRRRKARSMSPLRSSTAFQWLEDFKLNDESELTKVNEKEDKRREDDGDNDNANDNETPSSGASSRSSSVGRSSKRWIFLKELLYRSKSEGRNSTNNNTNRNLKFWSTLSFNPNSSNKNQKSVDSLTSKATGAAEEGSTAVAEAAAAKSTAKKAVNGLGLNRKRVGRSASAHEVHYTRNRAQAEEMRKKTYLPYRQGLLGCLGFSSKSYGAMNGFARALNPVSSR